MDQGGDALGAGALLRGLGIALVGMWIAQNAHAGDRLSASLVCRGNEPFWSFEKDGPSARFTRLQGAGQERLDFQGEGSDLGYLDPPWFVWRGKGREDPSQTIVVVARVQTCLDTMSDEGPAFDMMAVVSSPEGRSLVGCCFWKTAGE
jgi:uncharacterized membrane protein